MRFAEGTETHGTIRLRAVGNVSLAELDDFPDLSEACFEFSILSVAA